MGGVLFAIIIAGFLLTGARYLALGTAIIIGATYYFIPADDYGPELALLLTALAGIMLMVRLLLKAIALRTKK